MKEEEKNEIKSWNRDQHFSAWSDWATSDRPVIGMHENVRREDTKKSSDNSTATYWG